LSQLATSFVLGYHGCDKVLAEQLVNRRVSLIESDTKYDWLGPGIYFWEANPLRALEWAQARCDEGKYAAAGVVGAVIDLRNCLDLLNHSDQELLREAYDSLVRLYEVTDRDMPVNRNAAKGGDTDRRVRELDCDVIKHLHWMMDYPIEGLDASMDGEETEMVRHFDTVRGMFTEGDALYPGAAFYRQSHVQIAVRNPACIRGLFCPPELDHLITL
jgi:hypothetical protein